MPRVGGALAPWTRLGLEEYLGADTWSSCTGAPGYPRQLSVLVDLILLLHGVLGE